MLLRALPLSRGADDGRWEAVIQGNLSRAYAGLGRFDEALVRGEAGLALRRRISDLDGEVSAMHHVARAWQGLGDHERAIQMYREAIPLGRAFGNFPKLVAELLDTLAGSLRHTGDIGGAVDCWREAVLLYEEGGHPYRAAEVRRRLLEAGG